LRPAPLIDEHGRKILTGILRIGESEIDELVHEGVCGFNPEYISGGESRIPVRTRLPLESMKEIGWLQEIDPDYKG
jgi:hypothetical protein